MATPWWVRQRQVNCLLESKSKLLTITNYSSCVYSRFRLPIRSLLPLELYEDTELETQASKALVEAIATGEASLQQNAVAAAVFLRNESGSEDQWVDATVLGYDSQSHKFEVRTRNGMVANAHRLNVCLKDEDRFEFAKRYKAAQKLRARAEALLRYNLYVDCMPADEQPDMDMDQVSRILGLALASPRLGQKANASQLLEEVSLDYVTTMNKLVLDANREYMLHEFPELAWPVESPAATVTGPTIEAVEGFDLETAFTSLTAFSAFLVDGKAIQAMLALRTECDKVLNTAVFDVDIHESLTLRLFEEREQDANQEGTSLLRTRWVNNIVTQISTLLEEADKEKYDFSVSERAEYEGTHLHRLLGRANLMMADTLRFQLSEALNGYARFITEASKGKVQVKGTNQVDVEYDVDADKESDPQRWAFEQSLLAAQRAPPLFTLVLLKSAKESVINQGDVDAQAAKRAEWLEENTPKDGSAAKEECPFPVVEPVVGLTFEYDASIDSFVTVILAAFDSAIERLSDVTRVEVILMDRLYWPDKPAVPSIRADEPWVVILRSQLEGLCVQAAQPLSEYRQTFDSYIEFLNLDLDAYLTEVSAKVNKPPEDADDDEEEGAEPLPNVDLKELRAKISEHRTGQQDVMNSIPADSTNLGMFSVSCANLRTMLYDKHEAVISRLLEQHTVACSQLTSYLSSKFASINRKLGAVPKDVEQLTKLGEYMDGIPAVLEVLQETLRQMEGWNKVLDEFHWRVEPQQSNNHWTCIGWPKQIYEKIEDTEVILQDRKDKFQQAMMTEQNQFMVTLQDLQKEAAEFQKYSDISQVDQVAAHVKSFEQKLRKADEDAQLYNAREGLFEAELTDYELLQTVKKSFEPYNNLWATASQWLTQHREWTENEFMNLNAEEVESNVDKCFNAITKAAKFFQNNDMQVCADIATSIKDQVQDFKPNVPLIVSLRNPGMRDRHWMDLSEKLSFQLNPAEDHLTLNNILNFELGEHAELIAKVSESAGKEYQIEKALDSMLAQWQDMDLNIQPYRDTGTCVLTGVEEIQAMLDEHITMTQAMQFSAFKKAFEERIEVWDQTLTTVSDVLEEWMAVQRNWLYLQPIFESPDINKQLPTEGKRFAQVDKNWRQALANAKAKPNAVKFCNNDKLLERFQESNLALDIVQKGLSDYLETKRGSFARFYFLSNDELLSILSESKNVTNVQPHMKKCFEGIKSVTFEEDLTITAFTSPEREEVQTFEPVDPKEKNVEHWMSEVEDMMRTTIRDHMYRAILDYAGQKRTDWMLAWPAMCVLNGSQLHWTKEMEAAMNTSGNEGLKGEHTKQIQQLADMVLLVRGNLTGGQRTSVGALAVIDVHARDTTAKMIRDGVKDTADFMWSSQLRYYWLMEEGNIGDPIIADGNLMCQMVTSRRPYGYEYLGNSFRLVITPLTDKCYLTIMSALQMILGGAPAGPAGTGKTETTKDLAKALAKQCIVFNCSDGLDYIAMGKFFKGIASCGAWACFDEFNRIDIEVLSVVGQQISTIQQAIQSKKERIMFEDSEIRIDPALGVFITMNPGYAGRSDLPDSLAALFRPVAMMVPDYALIGEIMFFAYGFEKAKLCGAKMVTTFKLCSEQLSSQSHYDYGMRAVKTVITAAGNLKRNDPDMDEETLLLRALQDVNLPKFLKQDLPLFAGIISDLFPGKKRPQIDLGALNVCIKLCTDDNGLQCHPFFLTKTIQLYETICVRHGLMVVGPTGGGKSCNIAVLSAALSKLKLRNEQGVRYENVKKFQLNPKSITMGQLYGQFDPNTHEWQDGILSTLYRTAANDPSPDSKWVVFDGPVDAIWIENMNTVLDDNKKLCLNSGEMLQMSDQMTMMFEVEDLSVASPATVSRCGMVYMEPQALGLNALVHSWFDYQLPPLIPLDTRMKLQLLFDMYLAPGIALIRQFCKELAPTMDNNLAQSLMHLLSCYMDQYKEVEGEEPPTPEELAKIVKHAEPLFIFSLVWSVGCTVNLAGRQKFDSWLRSEMQTLGSPSPFPSKGLVYDYVYSMETGQWKKWMETVGETKVNPKLDFSEIIIPTMDSVRNQYLLQILTSNNRQVLMVGDTGTGKTVNISQFLSQMDDKYIPLTITFSAQTSANQTQDTMDAKMDKRRKGIFGPVAGKKYVIYVDDLNMPKREVYFAQPPIEILRQWFDQSGWYDRQALVFRKIIDIQFVASMGPPGGGRNPITPRFMRHFNVIGYSEMSDESKGLIFSTILDSFFVSFPEQVQKLTEPLVSATIDIYNSICKELLPTPAKSHYTFNLRDLAKVFQGVLMASDKVVLESDQITRLWMHENKRVFEDRLINEQDHQWFAKLQDAQLQKHFGKEYGKVVTAPRLIYGDYMDPTADPKVYSEVADLEELQTTVKEYLRDYNAESKSPMPLVMFLDAIEHVSRIARVIRQPQGNALLLGVGGSGRQSMTKLATYIAGFAIFQVEISKGYGVVEWRDDLKSCLLKAGLKDSPVVFLFSDVQVVNEIMLEDINNVLNAGDVPNLYGPEELDQINSACRVDCQRKKIPPTKLNIYTQYIIRVRRNIHVCLCMSPIGEAFRNRLRMFPALVNCCTIDWFSEWPADALDSVAQNSLSGGDLKLGDKQAGLVEMFKFMHQSVETKSVEFWDILRRRNYVTPTSYLELLSTFKTVLETKREEVNSLRSRLQVGVDKINTTKAQVSVMKKELVELQPVLAKTQIEVGEMMVQIKKDTEEADKTKAEVQIVEEGASTKAAATKAIAEDAQRDLDEALPALDAAVACLNKLKTSDLDEVKGFKVPPAGVKLTMEVVCIMFQHKPQKIKDPDDPSKKILDYWGTAKATVLQNANKFMEQLKTYDKDNIPDEVIKKIAPYVASPDFTPKAIEKASKACTAICMWARAMDTYNRVAKQVEPKKKALKEAQASLDITMAQLAQAQSQLKSVQDRLAELDAGYKGAVAKKEELANKVKRAEIQLANADKLIGGLGGEGKRWTETTAKLTIDYENLTGDVVVSAGTIGYLGPFTAEFRQDMVKQWQAELVKAKLSHTEGCDVELTLNEPVKLRSWQLAGLATDAVSTQNGIIMSRSRRWPLCIDPQGQANRFIRNFGKDPAVCENSMDICKLTDKNFLRALENGVRFGKWVLMENVQETLDASLETILLQTKFKQGGVDMMKIGDNTIPYNDSFRFYLTTKLPNPHYAPEVCVKVTLLNFAITMGGLEEQLLGVAVQEEMPDLAETKTALTIGNAQMKKELYNIESTILHLLSHSEGNILDDTNLIETLAQAKATSLEVTQKMKEAEITEKEIDVTSANYKPVAYRAALLFFCIADLSKVDSMYQYSLPWFTDLFIKGMQNAESASDLEQRLQKLKDFLTYSVYKNVCRSLFERHKLLFSFLMCIKILQGDNQVDGEQWRFLISGTCGPNFVDVKNTVSWVEKRAWAEVCAMSTIKCFDGLATGFSAHDKDWRAIFDSAEPHNLPLPGEWDKKLNSLQKMCVLRALRPDKVSESIQNYVTEYLDEKFIKPPPFDLPNTFTDSSPTMPLIFILTAGSDPGKDLLLFAQEVDMVDRLASIALGQGQGKIAAKMIEAGVGKGGWVLLQNCHLCISWMPELERICEDFVPDKMHEDFRLWLTSLPSMHFPTAILQNGVKMTKEPPKGLRANLNQSYYKLDDEQLAKTCKPDEFKKLLFALCFFHASIIERKKFGPLGWNIPYAFNDTDLDISASQMELFLDTDDKEIPYKVLCFMTSVVNYGGRVTDDKDMRTSEIILDGFFRPDSLRDDYSFSKSGTYKSVAFNPDSPHQSYCDYIDSLPINPEPEVFGMHDNANISCAQAEVFGNFDLIMALQPRTASGGGKSREDMIGDSAKSIEDRLPRDYNIESIAMQYPVMYSESMNTVLVQELGKFNKLTFLMRKSLFDIQKALQGLIVMSGELEQMGNSMFDQKVPEMWVKVAYPSMKPLNSWVLDLLDRLRFYQDWVDRGIPAIFWISAFYFPQAFMTGTLQNYARKHEMPIDTVSFGYDFLELSVEEIDAKPEDGCYVRGLFCEGARWDVDAHGIEDPLPKELFATMPVIHLLPIKDRPITTEGIYRCPVYKVLTRTGTLSTTGHSTNFVFWLEVPSKRPTVFRQSLVSETNANIMFCDQEYWIKAGVACFCALKF
jgi:dynein heavy chain